MKLGAFTAVAIGSAFLIGCSHVETFTTNIGKTIDDAQKQDQPAVSQPAVVPATLQCSSDDRYRAADNCCIMSSYTVGVDVDTAFARAMKEFSFPEKRSIATVRDKYHGHRYSATPGAYYQVADDVFPRSVGRLNQQGVWVKLTLSKATASSATVEPVYCERFGKSTPDQLGWHKSVQQAIRSALPPR